jgi:hypothetical protein
LYVSYDEELDKELATAADSIAALPSPMLMDKVLEILLESDAMPVRRLCVCLAPSLPPSLPHVRVAPHSAAVR